MYHRNPISVIEYLENSAARFPEKKVFSDAQKSVSYKEVLDSAKKVASALCEYHKINKPVAVIIDRNVESLCSFLGVSMSRNFYVPIDAGQPPQRIKTILNQMQPFIVISALPHDGLPDEIRAVIDIPVLYYSELLQTEINEKALADISATRQDTDPLYAICTSGSTGTPKGVLISQRSVLDFISVFVETFRLDENDVFGNQAPFDFDVSVKDIYSTLYCGASMHIIPKVCFSMPKKLVEVLDEQHVTTIIWAVSALCIAAGVNAFKHRIPKDLRKIMFSGEVMPIKMLNIWRAYYPDALFVNLYGPTEITCNCMYYIIDRDFSNMDKLPLGIPFKNEGVYVLNESNQPVSSGETGEICVTGTCLGLGYYRNPERTAAAFVQNPLNNCYSELMYRTGDLAELRADGQYYFAARKDFQIKHMGHRIELEEIETYMNAVDGVMRACCLFDEKRNKIVAYYAGSVDKAEIIAVLKADLPKYMIPNIFIQEASMPLNKNGKIDRQKLRTMYEQENG